MRAVLLDRTVPTAFSGAVCLASPRPARALLFHFDHFHRLSGGERERATQVLDHLRAVASVLAISGLAQLGEVGK